MVIPVKDDAEALSRLLAQLCAFRDRGLEIIVVDGGSSDGSAQVAHRAGVRLIESPSGRGLQLNTGVRSAIGDWIWMLHADSQVTLAALTFIRSRRIPGWGRFDVAFEPAGSALSLVALFMNWRSRQTGICTGDQGLFVHRRLLLRSGGVPEQPLMEDVELSRRLKRLSPPVCPRIRVLTSSRRWRRDGVLRTIASMWVYRIRYWLGDSPETLARDYYG